MSKSVILKQRPKIEFQLLDDGFELIDGQTKQNNDFYSYDDVQSIELNKPWFPTLAKWLRALTWIFNGVPYFPDAGSYKKANLIIHFKTTKLGIWLTDTNMAEQAKRLKKLLDERAQLSSA